MIVKPYHGDDFTEKSDAREAKEHTGQDRVSRIKWHVEVLYSNTNKSNGQNNVWTKCVPNIFVKYNAVKHEPEKDSEGC